MTGRRNERGQRGQSTVEFALVLPIVFVVLLALVQVGVVIYAQIAVTHTAREVARVLAVDPAADPHAAAVAATSLKPDRLEVTVSFAPASTPGRQFVIVEVRYLVPAISGAGGIVGDIATSATASMLVEG